jgi:hypothetical protein
METHRGASPPEGIPQVYGIEGFPSQVCWWHSAYAHRGGDPDTDIIAFVAAESITVVTMLFSLEMRVSTET